MSHKSFARFRAISVAIFVIGAVSAGFAYSLRKPNAPTLKPRKGFILTTKSTVILTISRPSVAREITHSNSIRYQRSNGTFKEVQTYYDANNAVIKKTIIFGIPGQGVFSLTNPEGPLQFLSSMRPKEEASLVRVDDGHTHPNFVRDEWVKGYQTYVLRFPDADGGYFEMYCAPELDGEQLRTVAVEPGGISIREVVGISLGDPDERVIGVLPNLPVGYDIFQQKLATARESGNSEVAEGMQRQLDEQLAKPMQ